MSDSYIDDFEVDEYGSHFVSTATVLIGASPLVNMQALIDLIALKTAAVRIELEKAGIKRSALRGGRGDTSAEVKKGRAEISKFWNFVNSLDEDVPVDKEAFFKGAKQGSISKLKAADLLAKLNQALQGFAADVNKNLPGGSAWQAKIGVARDTLATALAATGGAQGESRGATAALRTARDEFVEAYNNVAKKLVFGLLASLGRKNEYESFFKDLQVNEGKSKVKAAKAGEQKPGPA